MNTFVVVIPVCPKDAHLARKMLDWMAELGQPRTHRCYLSLTVTMRPDEVANFEAQCAKVFTSTKTFLLRDDHSRFPWPVPHNIHFQKTARILKKELERQPEQAWFWLEPDCVPLAADWLLVMEAEQADTIARRKVFTGALVSPPPPTSTPDHMTGNAIYPRDLARHAPTALVIEKTAWDVAAAQEIIPQANFTKRIQHVYGNPVFKTIKDADKMLSPQAVLFHQCKDGSLIERLREKSNARSILDKRLVEPTQKEFEKVRVKMPGKQRPPKLTKTQAKEIWTAYHIGINGTPPQTQVHLAHVYDRSISTIMRVVHHPETFGFKPPVLNKEAVA